MATANPDNILENEELVRKELEFYLNAETRSYDRSVLFIGITGQGKSSLCNFLMKEEKFKVEDSMMSCPEPSKQELTNLKGKNYLLVDVPGVCDTERDPKEVLSELVKTFFFVRKQGISAIAIMINPNQKMTTEHYEALVDFLGRISPDLWEHVIVVFTHEKQTIRKHKSGDEYITKMLQNTNCPKFLKFVSEKCKHRFLHVECETLPENEQYWEKKISDFTEFVESIMAKNGHLETEMMNKIDQKYLELIELKKQKEDYDRQLELMRKDPIRFKAEIIRVEKLQIETISSMSAIMTTLKGIVLASLGLAILADILGLGIVATAAVAAVATVGAVGAAIVIPVAVIGIFVFGMKIRDHFRD